MHNHLHHLDLPNHYQFVNFRTHDSVDSYLEKLNSQKMPNKIKQQEIDRYLDQSIHGAYLVDEVFIYLYNYLIEKDKDIYELIALCIMLNHVHLLFKPLHSLSKTMQIIKAVSSNKINKLIKSQNEFWAENYYDKLIRDEKHFNVVYNYIKITQLTLKNP